MPGIAGIIRRSPYDGIKQDLHLMVETMQHTMHYSSGMHINADLGLYAGWTCHKGSFSDCMPIVGRNNDLVLIFQGEDYRLNGAISGVQRPGHLNARYLLDLYIQHGEDFFQQLNGWYCGIVADLRTRKVTLFNDRYGMGRVYFHQNDNEFLFASEAKSLLKIRPGLRQIEPDSLAEHLRYNCVTKGRTLFKGVSLLPPASRWDFEGTALPKRQQYFDFAGWEKQPALEPGEFYSVFCKTISERVPWYIQGAEPVAFSLTAGLDTRTITAALKEHNRSIPCYTFGGAWGELFDVSIARKVAKIYDQPFECINVGPRFLKGFADYARQTIYVSDGTHDAFGAHDIYLNEIGRKIAPVRLTGKFGSEVVRIRRLLPSLTYPPDMLQPDFKSRVEALPVYKQINPNGHPLTRVVCEEIPWHEFGRISIEQSQVTLRTPYMDNDLVKLMYQAPPATRAAGRLQEDYVKKMSRQLAAIATNMGKFASENQLITDLLYGAMWALFKVEYTYLYATPHWMTRLDRTLASCRFERILAGRQKWEGYRIWINTEFPEFIQQTLLNPSAHYSRYFEKRTIENMVRRHIAGTHNYLQEINRVLTVELICSTLLGEQN